MAKELHSLSLEATQRVLADAEHLGDRALRHRRRAVQAEAETDEAWERTGQTIDGGSEVAVSHHLLGQLVGAGCVVGDRVGERVARLGVRRVQGDTTSP